MGRFDIDEALKHRKRLMLTVGTWPEEFPTLKYTLKGFFTVFMLLSFTVTILIQVAIDSSDLDASSFGISIALISIHALVKHIMVFSDKPQFYDIINSLRQPILALHDDHLDIFLQEKVHLCNLWPPVLLFGSLMTVGFALLCPLFDTQKQRPLVVPFPMNMTEQHWLVYFVIYGYQIISAVLLGITVPCYDGVNFTFIVLAAGQLRILREKIIRAADNISAATSVELRNQQEIIIQEILKDCVKHHIAIERYIMLLQKTFRIAFLVQLILSVLVHCFTGISLLFLPTMSIGFIRGILLLCAALIEIIFYCVSGNEIILQSQMIRDACYMSEWTECSTSTRKTLFMIMEKSKHPFALTAANFVDLSHATFIGVLQKSFSYFTVLRRLYGNTK